MPIQFKIFLLIIAIVFTACIHQEGMLDMEEGSARQVFSTILKVSALIELFLLGWVIADLF